ncbi:FxsA family protein [Wenjunlia tyrosinilytica]|uniref:Membrane protein n=1 Tax=Wenjunlia tyrosinilytica TaxID=1544741 RepID=A0A918DWZ6_9ACTN|nr:FxsA family protein [Wenjunlia tyrosinilytica]GGO87551.1 membrane protein [Wenjunlia tyrosinilytica]
MVSPDIPQAHQQPPRRRRSRARVVVPLAVAAWVVLEVWLLTVVAGATSAGLVLLLLAAGFVVGAVVVKRAGVRAWRGLTEAFQPPGPAEGAHSGGPSGDGGGAASGRRGGSSGATGSSSATGSSGAGLSMLGGALLMLPGFASDALGLLLILPPVQALIRKVLPTSRLATAGPVGEAYQQARIHRPDGKVVQGEVVDRDPDGS